ncbi:uncharacterized protein [Temnothorax longispinosus]|uniref:uncharacterized protein isoform X1 n=1 Tax=Temnothorax longispinosus TaxID=300112 RepID=UPI003A98F102
MLGNFLREYNTNSILLSTTGLWPFQNKLVKNLIWTFCFLVEMSYYPLEILLLYDHSDDAQLIFDGCFQVLISTSFVARHLNGILNYDKLRWMCETIDEHWNIFTDDIEIRVMKEYSMLSRKLVKFYLILLYITLLVLIITPLTPILLDIVMPLNESRPRFFVIEVEFRVNKDEYFLPIFCYITVLAIVSINITVSVDTMHIACTAHACSLFAAVSKQMENIMLKVNDNNNDIGENKSSINKKFDLCVSSEKMIYWKYVTCLKKHQLAIKFVDVLNSSYQVYALTFLIIVIGTMSVIGLRILYILDQLGTVIKFVLILMVSLSSLLITCYSGQRIMDESQNIFYGAYAAEWYKFSPRLKSLLIITLYRSSTPCELKAGNMIPLSIATYATVVRMSMSYYTALLSIQD